MAGTYPTIKYHRVHEPVQVNNVEEEEALGDEWKESPAAFGVVTHPSVMQQRQAKMDALKAQAEAAAEEQGDKQVEEQPAGPRRRR